MQNSACLTSDENNLWFAIIRWRPPAVNGAPPAPAASGAFAGQRTRLPRVSGAKLSNQGAQHVPLCGRRDAGFRESLHVTNNDGLVNSTCGRNMFSTMHARPTAVRTRSTRKCTPWPRFGLVPARAYSRNSTLRPSCTPRRRRRRREREGQARDGGLGQAGDFGDLHVAQQLLVEHEGPQCGEPAGQRVCQGASASSVLNSAPARPVDNAGALPTGHFGLPRIWKTFFAQPSEIQNQTS